MNTAARNCTSIEARAPGSPSQSVTAFTTCAIVNIPWAMIPGNPTLRANASSWCSGFWSPEASA